MHTHRFGSLGFKTVTPNPTDFTGSTSVKGMNPEIESDSDLPFRPSILLPLGRDLLKASDDSALLPSAV